MPKRIICDSNVHDAVATDAVLKRLIDCCQTMGHIVLVTTPIQITELSRIPETENIGQASAISAKRIGSAVVVLDHSGFDEDRLGSDATNAAFSALQKGNAKHTVDAMIGATALSDADILVTDDRPFGKKIQGTGYASASHVVDRICLVSSERPRKQLLTNGCPSTASRRPGRSRKMHGACSSFA